MGKCGFWMQEVNGKKELEIGYLFVKNHCGVVCDKIKFAPEFYGLLK